MDADELRAFVAVARDKRFTSAARRLSTSQPTLSRRVQHLEKELGARLVVRTSAGVVLTSAGARFLPEAERALASLEMGVAAIGELAGEPRGIVAIGAQHTIGAYALPPVLALFHKRYPRVRLRLIERLPPKLEDRVAHGDLDLALLSLPIRHVDLTIHKLWQEEYVLAVPPSHKFATTKKPVEIGDVASEPLVVIPNVPSTAALEAACAERGIEPNFVVEADNLEAARRMVERGLGVALLPKLVAQAQRAPRFVAVEIAKGAPKRHVAVIHRGEAYLSAAARALRSTIVERLEVKTR